MKQGWIDRLERKCGWLKIQGLIRYVIAIELVGALIGVFAPNVYFAFLSLDFGAIARGQIWRLFTFIFYPTITSFDLISILFLAIELYLYYMIGNVLENLWGAFRFTLYYLSGLLLSVVAAFIVYLTLGGTFWPAGLGYINETLFLAFATIFPNQEFLLYFIIPIKAKWFAILYLAIMGYDIIMYLSSGTMQGLVFAIAIVISMLNYFVFFLSTRNYARMTPEQRKRRREFKKNAGPKVVPIYKHRCAICGRTEKDGDDIEFRFCSKCEGNYEYCDKHIFTHEHVRNPM